MIKRKRDCAGYIVPSIPKAPRSARRIFSRKKMEDHELCAFDLLAAVAGKLLQENENSSASSNETETKDAMKLDEHLSPLSVSHGSHNVESDLRIGISVRADVKHEQQVVDEVERIEDRRKNNSIPRQIPKLHQNANVEFVNRDVNEIYVNCRTKRSKVRAYRSSLHTGNHRVRKFLGYRYWKTSPKLRDCEYCDAKPVKCSTKTYHKQDSGLENSSEKKRKLFDHNSVVTFDRGFCSESFSKSDDECANMNKSSSANEECSSTKNHSVSGHAKDSQVRLCIKSFKVPELFVEVPLNATVCSLKTTVLEAVTSVLCGGLHVEVMSGGKKIMDESDTLMHSGISHNCNLDSLSFMLEPSSPNSSPPSCQNDHLGLSPGNDLKPSKRSSATESADSGTSNEPAPLPSLSKQVKIDREVIPTSLSEPEEFIESKALALFPVTNAEPLAIAFPTEQKSKRSDLSQRRTRRPFSVSEVEALVQSVEELGTGRWRDVKIRSFKNADHRTYVDLKDKWKTLVHTAQISPQQRRGQPVPQELLNRVLATHSYWSQHHQIKPHA